MYDPRDVDEDLADGDVGADGDDAADDDEEAAADDGVDAICTVIVGDDVEEGADATPGLDGVRSARRSVPSELML
jgi:hypothetical protein